MLLLRGYPETYPRTASPCPAKRRYGDHNILPFTRPEFTKPQTAHSSIEHRAGDPVPQWKTAAAWKEPAATPPRRFDGHLQYPYSGGENGRAQNILHFRCPGCGRRHGPIVARLAWAANRVVRRRSDRNLVPLHRNNSGRTSRFLDATGSGSLFSCLASPVASLPSPRMAGPPPRGGPVGATSRHDCLGAREPPGYPLDFRFVSACDGGFLSRRVESVSSTERILRAVVVARVDDAMVPSKFRLAVPPLDTLALRMNSCPKRNSYLPSIRFGLTPESVSISPTHIFRWRENSA